MSDSLNITADEKLELLALSNDQISQGLARLIKGVLDARTPEEETSIFSTNSGAGSLENSLLLEDGTSLLGE